MSNTEREQTVGATRLEQFSRGMKDRLRGINRGVRISAAVLAGITPVALDSQPAYSADNIIPTAIVQKETKNSNIPDTVIATKDIHPVISPVTLVPDRSVTIPAGTIFSNIEQQQASYLVEYEGKSLNINPADVEAVDNSDATIQDTTPITSTEEISSTAPISATEPISNTQEIQIIKKTVITNSNCNARSEASTNSQIITMVPEGEVLEVTGEVTRDENGLITWRQVKLTLEDGTETTAWIFAELLDELTTVTQPPTSEGVGGAVQEPSATITETDSETGEVRQELSPAQDSMNRALPENFREYYESYGGNISWNSELQTYEVTFKTQTGEKKFILLPETGVKLTDESDLAAGLYFLGKEATLKITKEVDGKQVDQAIHFVVSPNFPNFEGHDFWADLPSSLEQNTEITIATITEEQKTQIAEALIKMFGLDESGSFNLFLGIGGDIKENFDKTDDKALQVRGLNSGSNDSETFFAGVTNQRSDVQTLMGIISPMKDLLTQQLLLNPELKQYYGSELFWSLLERLVTDSPWRDLEEDEAIKKIPDFQKFYTQLTDILFPIEAELTDQNGGTFVHVFDISIDPAVVNDYVDHLSGN